ncbi:hypothetical protein ACF090_05685 [Streptomyces sp. NPDC014892]|uniref:hypothetical protein n=1 Tax=Streptomyces sp. NPDC014892 TaxID=3364930 RepID=UPI0036FFD3EB
MPADEVTHGTSVGESRARSGPRHAAPKKPLLTRLNVPAGKAIALAAMPTAVLMGMGFTPTLTLARADDPTKLSLTADEYKDCVEALEAAEEGTDASATPTPTPTPSAEESTDSTDEGTSTDEGDDTSAGDDSADDSNSSGDSAADDTTTDDSASSDSGSDDKDGSAADESSTDDSDKSATDTAGSGEAPSADTSETDSGGNVLEDIGTAIEDLFTPDDKETETTTPSTSTSPSPSPSPSDDASGSDEGEKDDTGSDAGKDAQDTADNASDKVKDAAKDVTDSADDADKKAEDATDDATATPSPSPSESTDAEGCPVATDDESGVEKGIPPLPNDPWYLNASSLLLKGADYKGIVKVKTADGSVKEVLKYVISDGTDIGDLHQTVEDKQAGVTYHVQAGKGTTSTIREGKTIMYTESISGNLLGLIPVTFDPKHPPPLNIPLIYFTKVKVVQAGQFGGTLTVPGMHQFTTD